MCTSMYEIQKDFVTVYLFTVSVSYSFCGSFENLKGFVQLHFSYFDFSCRYSYVPC